MDSAINGESTQPVQRYFQQRRAAPIRLREALTSQDLDLVMSETTHGRATGQSLDSRHGPLISLVEQKGFRQHFQPNSTVLLHGDPANAVYFIESGIIRCCTIDGHGRRQIFSFAKKGEFVGLSDTDRWHFTAEAVDHVIVKSVPRAILEQEIAGSTPLRHEVRAYIRGLLEQREKLLLTLANANGPDRLYGFLEDFAASRSNAGYVVLPMCRRDIGDHIGLSTESVSRAFSDLKRKGRIDLKSHEKYRIVAKSEGFQTPERSHTPL
ncbi:Crp/Fnr family transcriptional regulator [Aquicoccus sp. SU-CL01552]|uniref:Crp/Fnr family transcriptional regulator n=1 Tax=Aquicoccus sp. SU-CL01552 TaxID=3127656 RepID=UPI0033424775